MIRYVIDAGVAVKCYVPEIHTLSAEKLLDENHELHAPDLILPEFSNIIWRKIRRSELSVAKGRQIIETFLRVPLQRHPADRLVEPAFVIADRTAQTIYDSIYLVLAIALNCKMVTADEKFYETISQTPFSTHILWVQDLP
ncbi:MAG: type II toxin-antitoxin system VapC family toxin [Acidobacteria bacterium]|nr:type II toxin-antitoxin system VapC family toxin [Acidobacteriota bacterium]